jgi:hypothetical protein
MKSIFSVITFTFLVCAGFGSKAQSQQQSGSELRPITTTVVHSNSLVESPAAVKPISTSQPGSTNSNEIEVIDGRKVHVDNQGIQSLSAPESIPAKENEIKNPE